MDASNGKAENCTQMKLELREVGGVTEGDHTRVVRTRGQLREDNFALLRQEELHAPDACTRQGFRHLVGHVLSLFQCLVTYLIWLPRLTIVAAFLHMSDGRTEERGPAMLLGDGEERELRVEVDKLFDDDLLYITTRALHGLTESLLQLIVVVHIALTVTR